MEILAAPGEGDDDAIRAKRHAAASLEGIEQAEEALRMWRDRGKSAVELLGEVGQRGDDKV